MRIYFSVSLKVSAWSTNIAHVLNGNAKTSQKHFMKSTNSSEYDLREFVALKLTHHRNLSCSLCPKATGLKAVNTAGTQFRLLSCAMSFTPARFQLCNLSCPLQKKMSVRDTHCPSFAE